jgi:uncharacterized protein (UPF0261 family)
MTNKEAKRTVLIIITLDTKGDEARFFKERILEDGLNVIILDTGILGEPRGGVVPDIPASDTARAAGTTLEELRRKGSRGAAVEEMLKGAAALTAKLHKEGRIHGAISLGGAEGGVMAASAMQVLPPGFPKIIITPLASGIRPFGPFIGIRDIMVMHSLIDISGINEISRTVFSNAAAAIAGMVRRYKPMEIKGDNLVATTMLGTTDRGMKFLIPKLREAGYEAIVFHSSGVGGQVMEDMIGRGFFCGVVDLSTNELTDHVCGGFHNAGPHRLEAAGNLGLPQVIVPGCVDFFALGARDTVPEKFNGRKMYYHNPAFTLIRPSVEEMQKIGNLFVRKLNEAKGPVRVVLPLRGMSISGLEGGSTHDPEGDRVLFDTIEKGLKPHIPVIEVDAHVNEERFIDRVVIEFLEITGKTLPVHSSSERRRT